MPVTLIKGGSGGTPGPGSVTDAMLQSPVSATYRKIIPWRTVNIPDTATGGGYMFREGATAQIAAGNINASSGVVYLDPADFAITGRTTRYRVRAVCLTNATAPNASPVIGLYPVSAVAGGADTNTTTLGTVQAGSTVTFTTPAASTRLEGNSGDFTAPAAGWYIMAVQTGSQSAADASYWLSCCLQMRNT